MKETTLVIMAAGIGSRFGKGIKQLTPVGPSGELIMDYSVYDALKAGFNNVVFIIRKDIQEEFHERIGRRISKFMDVKYVFQELDDIPEGFTKPAGRTKPWGTGQAILCCKALVNTPFAVINADDYYGIEPYRLLHDYLAEPVTVKDGVQSICLAGFELGNTLSDHGGVTRGICEVDENNNLTGIDETKNIIRVPEGGKAGEKVFSKKTPVSMNMWGFRPEFIDCLEEGFRSFLSGLSEGDISSEFLLPIYVDELLKSKKAEVKVIKTTASWFGVTYQEDKEAVIQAFRDLTDRGVYGKNLYEGR